MRDRIDYRPDIDGLRAIAVLSVIAYHYGVKAVGGGFVGVDVFFVISGFLITSILKGEIQGGTFSLLGFYDRRIRRIVPALLVVLAATLAAGWALLMPGDYASLGDSASYAAFGLGNLFFYWHTGYFDQTADLQPLLHTWSLGVEEQFYLAWPALLWIGMKLVRSERIFRWLFGLFVGLAFAYGVRKTMFDPKAAFYLAPPRAWELAIGGLLAYLPIVRRGWSLPMELAGIGLVGLSALVLRESDSFPGLNAAYPCFGAALLLWPKQHVGAVGSLLGLTPLRWIGRLSYSLYLWHWPVLVLFRFYANGATPSPLEAIALAAVVLAVSWLSWRFVEVPFRRAGPVKWRSPAFGLAGCVTLGVLGYGLVAGQGVTQRISPAALRMSSLDVMWQWNCPRTLALPELTGSYCNFGLPWSAAATRGILWGDSHAEHMAPIVEAAARHLPASFLLYPGCPAAFGGDARRIWPDRPNYVEECALQRQQGIQALHDHPEINLVILAASWSNLANVASQDGAIPGDPDPAHIIGAGLDDLIAQTARPGRRFIIIGDVPQYRGDPTFCALNKQLSLLRRGCPVGGELVRSSAFRSYQTETYQVLTAVAGRHPATGIVLPGDALCAGEWCEAYLDGEFLYRDNSHLRRNLAERTREDFAALIGLTARLKSDS